MCCHNTPRAVTPLKPNTPRASFFNSVTVVFLLHGGVREIPKSMCNFGYKYSAVDVCWMGISAVMSTGSEMFLILRYFIGFDPIIAGSYMYMFIMSFVFVSSFGVTTYVLKTCAQSSRAEKELLCHCQLSLLLGYPQWRGGLSVTGGGGGGGGGQIHRLPPPPPPPPPPTHTHTNTHAAFLSEFLISLQGRMQDFGEEGVGST